MTSQKPDMVEKALSLVVLLGDSARGETATELSKKADLPFSTTYRLLGSLTRSGFVALNRDSKRYELGIRVFQLGQRVSHSNGFAGASLPVLRSLTEQTREATILGILDGDHVLTVSKVDGPQAFRVTSDPGTRSPLHTTALGKVLVAFASPEISAPLLDELELIKRTEHTIADRREFRDEIARVRENGFATMREENEVGMQALAVPVGSADGRVVAALAIAAPVFRLPFEELMSHLDALKDAAAEIAARLPWR